MTQSRPGDRERAEAGDHRPDQGRAGEDERVDEEEQESFPASDPHSDWAGPPS